MEYAPRSSCIPRMNQAAYLTRASGHFSYLKFTDNLFRFYSAYSEHVQDAEYGQEKLKNAAAVKG